MLFEWELCVHCGVYMIRCPKCKNNCCNGGYGEIDEITCDVCSLAYQYQSIAYEHDLEPQLTEQDVLKIKQYEKFYKNKHNES
jgi:CRISPR/Cas system-associated protein Cas10 (large subunit of type III CRISPR-Cas system)